MTMRHATRLALLITASLATAAGPVQAQNCTQGLDVSCDDGRHGIFEGNAIVWPDGSRAGLHPSVIIDNKSSVVVGKGVFVGRGKGMVPLDDPNASNKTRCAILDGAAYCY